MSFSFMPLYTGDYLRDTRHLSMSEHGCYLLLLTFCWDSKGPVPLDERKIAGICNARSGDEVEAMRRVLSEFFVRMEDGHYNKRIQAEIERSENISRSRSEAGRKGYEAKAKHLPSNSQASASTPTPTPTTTPTPTPKKEEAPRAKRAPRVNALMPEGWLPSKGTEQWYLAQGHPVARFGAYVDAFQNICRAKGYQYADFDAAFRNCVTKDWPGLRAAQSPGATNGRFDPFKANADFIRSAGGGGGSFDATGDVWEQLPAPIPE